MILCALCEREYMSKNIDFRNEGYHCKKKEKQTGNGESEGESCINGSELVQVWILCLIKIYIYIFYSVQKKSIEAMAPW